MNLSVLSFADAGEVQKERLVLKASADIDVGRYAVFKTVLSADQGATAGWKAAFWFPDKAVRAGDLIVLYTKSGTQSDKKLENGRIAHFFYWGQTQAIWTAGNGAVVLEVAAWTMKPVLP